MKKTDKTMKILIVDDVAAAHLLYKHALKNDKYEIFDAERGRDALSLISKTNLDLVILDLDLPDMSGLEVLDEIRKSGNDVPVIILTAYGVKEYVVKAAAKGVNYYLIKPVELAFLRKRVEEVLSPVEKKYSKLKSSTKMLMESLAEIENDASMTEHVKELKKQIKEIASKLGDIEKEKKDETVTKDYFFNKEVVCPVCAADFFAINYKQKNFHFVRRDADFHEVYEGSYSPIMFDVWVCPECLYAAKKDDFGKIKVKEIELIAKGKEERKNIAGDIDFKEFRNYESARMSYLLAANCYDKIGYKNEYIGNLYLKSAWIAREKGKSEEEKKLIKESLKNFAKAEETGEGGRGALSELGFVYLMGELYRRVDDFVNAEKYFNKVIEQRDKTKEKDIVKMAATQFEQLKLERNKKKDEDDSL